MSDKKKSFGNTDCTMDMGVFALFTPVSVEKNGYFGNIVHTSFVSTFAHMKPNQERLNNHNVSEGGQTCVCVCSY